MTQEDLERLQWIDQQIRTIRDAAWELKKVSGGLPAVDCNTDRILASTKMLEINISDVLKLL
jgi:hypothetical protein